MVKRLLLIATVFLFAGCRSDTAPGEPVGGGLTITGTEQVRYLHDDKRHVGCWFYISGSGASSISCLPDSQYTP